MAGVRRLDRVPPSSTLTRATRARGFIGTHAEYDRIDPDTCHAEKDDPSTSLEADYDAALEQISGTSKADRSRAHRQPIVSSFSR
jgi:hypothetical protein